jgi:hypothetical protein
VDVAARNVVEVFDIFVVAPANELYQSISVGSVGCIGELVPPLFQVHSSPLCRREWFKFVGHG